jgi:hypothetical protein
MTDIVVKGRQAQLFHVSHFNPAGIALTSFFIPIQTPTPKNAEILFCSVATSQLYKD